MPSHFIPPTGTAPATSAAGTTSAITSAITATTTAAAATAAPQATAAAAPAPLPEVHHHYHHPHHHHNQHLHDKHHQHHHHNLPRSPQSMATDTETLSLPPTTAPTEVTAPSPSMPHKAPPAMAVGAVASSAADAVATAASSAAALFPGSVACKKRRLDNGSQQPTATAAMDWDTGILTPALLFPQSSGGPSEQLHQHLQQQQPLQHQQQQSHLHKHLLQQAQQAQSSSPPSSCPSNFSFGSVEESCRRSLDHFPNADVSFPMPSLDFDFRVAVTLNSEPSRIENRARKEITTVSAGKWSGSFGNGRVVAGGYDLGQARGFRPIRIVEGAFVLQTTDEPPAMLEMRTRGSLSGPCAVLDTLLSPRKQPNGDIDQRQYGFRMFTTIKTADKRYAEIVNCGLWVASGVWKGEELILDAYRVT